jgi:hypothetical protein
MKPLIAGAGILGLIVLGYSAANKYLAVKAQNSKKSSVKPEKIQRWEEEGGALPVTGSQLGPEPARPSNI